MTLNKSVEDDQLGQYYRRTMAIADRLGKSLPFEGVMETLQRIHDGEFGQLGIPVEEKPTPLFSVIATTVIGAFGEKKTAACFPKPRYLARDSNLDTRLPATQPKADACTISTLGLTKDWTFAESVRALPGAPQTNDVVILGRWLIENGHTITLAQAEEMVEKTERGEKTGMCADGYNNFFFVETGNEENPVSVGRVFRGGRGWRADVSSLDDGIRWYTVHRLVVRNLDTRAL